MVYLNDLDTSTRTAVFSASSASELSKLPNLTDVGKENLSTVQPIAPGSSCYLTDGTMDIYILDGDTNTWKLS